MLDDVLCAAHYYCGDAIFFQMPGGQTHGLVAHRSIGNKNGGISSVGATSRQQFRAVGSDRRSLAAVGRHSVKARGHRADPACRRTPP